MSAERLLDVSALEPPEPLERVLAALEELGDGEYLHVQHRREPFPLYPLLEERGFAYFARPGRDVPIEVFIWRRNDEHAHAAAQRRGEARNGQD